MAINRDVDWVFDGVPLSAERDVKSPAPLMIKELYVSPAGNRLDLLARTASLWTQFSEKVRNHPLVSVATQVECRWPDELNSLALAVPKIAPDSEDDQGVIVIGSQILEREEGSDSSTLTLLHEAIHLYLLTGDMRDRTRRIERIRIEQERINLAQKKADRPKAQALDIRLALAFFFLNFPDEIWAEVFLRDKYPEHFDTRMAAYLLQRDGVARRTAHPLLTAKLEGYRKLYEWLTLKLGKEIDLDDGRRARFAQLQNDFERDLERQVGKADADKLIARGHEMVINRVDARSVPENLYDQIFFEVLESPIG